MTQQLEELVAGRELDAEIAEKVMGWHAGEHGNWWCDDSSQEGYGKCERELVKDWSPSTSIEAAWQVVEQLRLRGYRAEVWSDDAGIWRAEFSNTAPPPVGATIALDKPVPEADTAPLAICRAALQAS